MDCQKHLFSLEPHIHYLNGAYMSPLMQSVEAAGVHSVSLKSRPYQISPSDFFTDKEKLRGLFAELVHAPSADHVAFIPAVSYGIAVVAQNVKVQKGQKIVVADAQFPSNVYAWRRLAKEKGIEVVSVDMPASKLDRGKTWNEHILAAIDAQTAIVAIGHIHWANGTIFDLAAISKKVHSYGGLLIVDGTQSVGALPIDVQEMGIDALVCGGYKWLMGGYSLGYAYYSDYFWNGTPLEENWINRENSQDFAGLTQYRDGYQPGARRFDVGEHSNFILVPMGIVALEQLIAWQPMHIQQYCKDLVKDAVMIWKSKGYWVEDEAFRAAHLFGIQVPEGADAVQLQKALKDNNISVSVRGDFIRVSPNVYNDAADIAALTRVLVAE